MLKAVIFDMDGVIIDSEPLHYEVNQQIFENYGLNISEQEYSSFIGISNQQMWTTIKAKYQISLTVSALVELQQKGNLDYLKNSDEKPMPGILKLLNDLQIHRVKIGLASSSPREYIDLVLKKFAMASFFQVVVSGEDVKNSKPAPDIFLQASKLINTKPEDCLVIEDSNHGVISAKSAGMKCIGFRNKNSGNQDLSKADLIIDKLDDLNIDCLKKLF